MNNNYRVGAIEFRALSSNDPESDSYEIVRWSEGEDPYCYAIAFFDRFGSGYNIISVGPRLLEAVEECAETRFVWRYAEEFLKLEFEAEERKKRFEESL